MSWIILVQEAEDAKVLATSLSVATTREFIEQPHRFAKSSSKIISLARSHAYQTEGYYSSLLAEARGLRVIPSVETILDLASRDGYGRALPELEDALNRDLARLAGPPAPRFLVCFGQPEIRGLEGFSRLLFDWFRAPSVQVTLRAGANGWWSVSRLVQRPIHRMTPSERDFMSSALAKYVRRSWRAPKLQVPPRYSIAVLHDPREVLPPSSTSTLRHWAREAEKMGVEVEPIGRRDLAVLAEFDALFIRETTSIRNHTFRFARRARAEGMPVIDDPTSMVRCTNKVYLWELLKQHKLPSPDTMLVSDSTQLTEIADRIGFPVVLKIPDGSFSRGVAKATTLSELGALRTKFLSGSAFVLAQRFMPTDFDWRIGVLGNAPLFAVQYKMARGHWQIVKHRDGKRAIEGGFRTIPISEAPRDILDTAVRAANLIGDGFYGVDLKETPDGPVIIEVNDNPNLEHGVEDQAEKREVWRRLTDWFVTRL